MSPSNEMEFNFRVQALPRLNLETYGWYPYVRIFHDNMLYAEFNGKGVVEFDTYVWAQGVADMILDAEMQAIKRAIQSTAEKLKNQ